MKKLTSLILICSFCWPCSIFASEKAQIMMLRPEKIRSGDINITEGTDRDPFNWSAEQAGSFRKMEEYRQLEQPIDINLSGIIWDNHRPLAVLNNMIVAEGDTIDNLLVIDIYPEEVLVQQKNVLHTLKFNPLLLGIDGN